MTKKSKAALPETPKRQRVPQALVPVTRARAVCTFCLLPAVMLLPDAIAAAQPDGVNAVCHPEVGGCNHGFVMAADDVERMRAAESL